MINEYAPIWRDIQVALGEEDSIPYEIVLQADTGDKVIFTGVATKGPNQAENVIIPNEVCANYLKQSDPTFERPLVDMDVILPAPESQLFFLIRRTDTDEDIAGILFGLDWSYEYNGRTYLSAPITDYVTRDSVLAATAVEVPQEMDVILWDDMGGEAMWLFENYDFSAGAGNAFFTLDGLLDFAAQNFPNVKSIGWTGANGYYCKFKIAEGCTRYTLFYVNAFGGWDFLPLVSAKVSEEITRQTTKSRYLNERVPRYNQLSTYWDRGLTNYQNEVTKKWTLGTNWISDKGAENMPHLIGSNNVWLYERVGSREWWYPVVITDNALDIKSYRNQGGKLVRYDINVQFAQDRIRR